jgi:hypothetical protein
MKLAIRLGSPKARSESFGDWKVRSQSPSRRARYDRCAGNVGLAWSNKVLYFPQLLEK